MKTSNYILIALFVFVTASLLVLFISAQGHENGEGRLNFTQKEYPLDNINVIVAEPGVFINVLTSEKNYIKVSYPKDENEPENTYRVCNDTLFVSKEMEFHKEEVILTVTVYVSHLSSLVANNANIHVNDSSSDKLEINAKQAYVQFHNSSIEKITLQADHSEISMYSTKVNAIFGKLENKSTLRGGSESIQKIDVEKDQNSRFYLY